MKKILSMDGGGIRGLIPALLVAEMERRTGKKCAEMFDLIAGTSTGGILALGFSVKDNETGKPKYTALELASIYENQGSDIFKKTFWHSLESIKGVTDCKYSPEGLEKVLMKYLGIDTIGNAACKTMVTSYDIENRETFFFKNWRDEYKDIPKAIAGRATSAAPTYFPPISVNVNGTIRTLIDGGVYINNPAMAAYVEAMRLYPGEEIVIVSLGTGELIRPIPYESAKDWGLIGWVRPLLDCMFDASSDAVNYHMEEILGDSFYRLQTTLTIASDDMDNTTQENVDNMKLEVQKIINDNKASFDKIIEIIR